MPIMIACLAMRSDGSWHDDVDDDHSVCATLPMYVPIYIYILCTLYIMMQ